MNENAKFSMTSTIYNAYTDAKGNSKLSNILALAQQVSEQHCIRENLDYRKLADRGYAFLLVRLNMIINELPVAGQTVKVGTVGYLPERAMYKRTTEIFSEDDRCLVEIDSRWTMVDIKTHTISREVLKDMEERFEKPPEKSLDFRPPRLNSPKWLYLFEVRPCMIDVNRHLTNSIYGDILYDCMLVVVDGRQPRQLSLFYHKEALLGDTIEVLYENNESAEEIYVKGKVDGHDCFSAILYF